MLRKAAAVIAAVLYLANGNSTRADPGPVVDWLMNEPASLFDIGLLRLSLDANSWVHNKIVEQFAAKHGGPTFFLVEGLSPTLREHDMLMTWRVRHDKNK